MRVLIFSLAYHPVVGGAEVAVKEITDRIDDIEFDMVTSRFDKMHPEFERVGNINVYRIKCGNLLTTKLLIPYIAAIKAWQLHKSNNYDAFWAIMVNYSSGAPYIVNILRSLFGQKRVPIILTLQEGDSESHLTYRWAGLLNLSWHLALSRTSILTAISTYLLNRAYRLGYKGKAEVIPNGVDTDKFANKSVRPASEDIVLITTSRLVEKNGIGDVIDALVLLPENVRFKILGTGSLEFELKRKVENLKLEARVEFLGFVDQSEIPKHLHQADIFIRPSLSEGMGNSFIEAMAAGLPVIATPVGGIPDFLFDPDKDHDMPPTGLFCEVRDPKSIAAQVQRLMSNPDLREKLVENGRKLASEKYDWDLIAGEMKNRVFEPVSSY